MRHFIFVVAALAAYPAMAAPFDPGIYLALDSGHASSSSKYAAKGDDLSFGGKIGYQYTPNIGFDVYAQSLSFISNSGIFNQRGYYPDQTIGIAVEATMPLNEHFGLFARAGVGRTTFAGNRVSMQDKEQTDGLVGAGMRYSFNRHWSVNLEANYLTTTEVKTISFGGRFQF